MDRVWSVFLLCLLLGGVSSSPKRRERDVFLDKELPGPIYDVPTLPPEMEPVVEKRVPTKERVPPYKIVPPSYEKRIPAEDRNPDIELPPYEKRIPAEDKMPYEMPPYEKRIPAEDKMPYEMPPYEKRTASANIAEDMKDHLPTLGKRTVENYKRRDVQERSGRKEKRTISEKNMRDLKGKRTVFENYMRDLKGKRTLSENYMRDLKGKRTVSENSMRDLKGKRSMSDKSMRDMQERSGLNGKRVTAEERRIPYVPHDWPYWPWPYDRVRRQQDDMTIYRRTNGNMEVRGKDRSKIERSNQNEERSSTQSRALLKIKRRDYQDERALVKTRGYEENRALVKTRENYERRGMTMDQAKIYDIQGIESASKMTGTIAQHAVDLHRMYRLQEPASNMWHMRWNQDLADLAQGLADTCVFKHTNLKFKNGTSVGQNLGAVVGPDRSFEFIMKLFYDEKKDYDFSSHSWASDKMVGHFLQIVYWDSALVGCGSKRCPELYVTPNGQVWKDATYYVCDYWPPASWKDRPYEEGNPCSRCIVPKNSGLGWKCEVDGCADCTLGEKDCYEPIPCDYAPDKANVNCAFFETVGACDPGHNYHESAKYYCPSTCKVCEWIPDFVQSKK